MELFIPARINKDNKFGKGFGAAEMKRTVTFAAVGLGLGLVVGVTFLNDKVQTVLLSTICGGGFIGAIGYFFSVKNSINLSIAHYLSMVRKFYKEQRFFLYKKLKEW